MYNIIWYTSDSLNIAAAPRALFATGELLSADIEVEENIEQFVYAGG